MTFIAYDILVFMKECMDQSSAFNRDFFLVYKSTSSLEPADQYLFYSFALGAL